MHLRFASVLVVFASLLAAPALATAAQPSWPIDISKLSSKDQAERSQAAEDLAKLATSADADKIVAALATSLAMTDGQARYETVRLLAEFGTKAKSAIPALIDLLKNDKDDLVRAAAARSLGYIAEPTSDAVPALAEAIVDKDLRVRRSAVRALVHIHPGPAIGLPLYVKALQTADPATVAEVIATAAELGDKVVPGAKAGLKDPKARYWALLLLSSVGPAAKSAVPDVAAVLADEQPEVRMQAAMTLGEIGPDSKAAVSDLVKALDDKEAAVRLGAAFALGKIGSSDATPALEKQMSGGGRPFFRAVCAWALVQINPENQELVDRAIKLLGESLASKDLRVRRGAARALGESRVAPDKAASLLIAAMADPDPQVLDSVSQALAKMGGKHAAEIAAALGDKDRRECAVQTLARMGADAKGAVSQLAASLKDSTPMFRREALFVLAKIGPDSVQALPQVEAALADESPEVQYAAIYVLGKIGPPAKGAAATLRKNLSSSDEFLKMASVWALLQIEGKDQQLVRIALPIFTNLLKDERELRRIEAARSLGEIGAAAAPALPRLRELAESDTPAVRAAATAAIARITSGQK
jgi:HEAT repeat protein